MGAKDGGRKGGPKCRVMLPCIVAAGVQFSLALQLSLLTHAVRPLHIVVCFWSTTTLSTTQCCVPGSATHTTGGSTGDLQFTQRPPRAPDVLHAAVWVDVELIDAEGPVQSGVA